MSGTASTATDGVFFDVERLATIALLDTALVDLGASDNEVYLGDAASLTYVNLLGLAAVVTGVADTDQLNDSASGGAGNDQMHGMGGNDTLLGGDGNDILYGELGPINAALITVSVTGFGGNPPGNDSLLGGAGADSILGQDGDDTVVGGAGADSMVGGVGADWLSYEGSAAVMVDLATGTASGGDATGDAFSGFEAVLGGAGNDLLAGDASANTLVGAGGDDTIGGGAGADSLEGGAGNDWLTYAGSAGVVVDLATGSASGGYAEGDTLSGFEAVLGGSDGDSLTGNAGANTLDGAAGNDTINGAAGDDSLFGGLGNDSLEGGDGTDTAYFSGTIDQYHYGFHGDLMIISGPDGADTVTGTEFVQFGGSAAISFADLKASAEADELYVVGKAGVTSFVLPDIYSGPVSWLERQYIGSADSEVVIGTSRNDFFNLLDGTDAVNAGAGDDVIDGGLGSNFLTGGAGRDDFFVDGRSPGTSTWSTITDWEAGERLTLFGWQHTGATLHVDLDADGTIDTSVTWAGLTQNDLPTPLSFDGLLWFT
jgi:Ca2+-binding RTX toxin-like protein